MKSASISLRDAGNPHFKNWGDVYDNRPLHCAAASVGHDELWKIRNIIRQGWTFIAAIHLERPFYIFFAERGQKQERILTISCCF
jgi:hypothetical protein